HERCPKKTSLAIGTAGDFTANGELARINFLKSKSPQAPAPMMRCAREKRRRCRSPSAPKGKDSLHHDASCRASEKPAVRPVMPDQGPGELAPVVTRMVREGKIFPFRQNSKTRSTSAKPAVRLWLFCQLRHCAPRRPSGRYQAHDGRYISIEI